MIDSTSSEAKIDIYEVLGFFYLFFGSYGTIMASTSITQWIQTSSIDQSDERRLGLALAMSTRCHGGMLCTGRRNKHEKLRRDVAQQARTVHDEGGTNGWQQGWGVQHARTVQKYLVFYFF